MATLIRKSFFFFMGGFFCWIVLELTVKRRQVYFAKHGIHTDEIYRQTFLARPENEVGFVQDFYATSHEEKDLDDAHYRMASHYNVDDYGVPLDKHLLSVHNMQKLSKSERVKKLKAANIKTVLYYHKAYGTSTYGFFDEDIKQQGQMAYILKGCRRKDCFCTNRKDFLPIEDFDAIVFYSRGLSSMPPPKIRKPHQRYVLWEMESPSYLMNFFPAKWGHFFNWTHTYRMDSDFWEPWGMMNQIKSFPKSVDELINEHKKKTYLAGGKTKSIAWFVTNCRSQSGRENYIRELQKYIQVDIYGGCGPFKCDRHEFDRCWEKVEREYYFYFSGENSGCKDYITEKFFNALKRNVIPIAYGGGRNTNDYHFAPKNSHINVLDFKSPKILAEFLLQLQTDSGAYASYFWWKPYYNVWLGRWKKAHCEICDRLHTDQKPQVYKDFREWWVEKAKCHKPY